MNFESPPSRPSRISEEIDALCDAFEAAFRLGEGPLIETELSKIDPEYRDDLFRELLEIEIDIRQQALDQTPEQAITGIIPLSMDVESEYRKRFPDYGAIITDVVRKVVKPRQLGDYELLKEIGHGGMGVVYRAVQKYLNQIVAIKVLPNKYLNQPQAITRFRREMLLIGGLNHPNIVRALNAGEFRGSHYLVMEFVEGTTVQQLLDHAALRAVTSSFASSASLMHRPTLPKSDYLALPGDSSGSGVELEHHPSPAHGSPFGMPVGAACEIVRQAALGLEHVHRFGLVHRDIKPANLMIDREGVVKILDLGLGKFSFGEWESEPEDTSLTKIGTMMGTTDYMAPEQWEDSMSADIRADIYSLGCTFFFMLTGMLPFGPPKYDTQRKKMIAHLSEPLPSPEFTTGPLPPGLRSVYERMTAKEPAQRFRTPEELAAAIEPFADPQELLEYSDRVLDRSDKSASDSQRSLRRPPNSRGNRSRLTRSETIAAHRFRKTAVLLAGLFACLLIASFVFRFFGTSRETPVPVAPVDSGELEKIAALQTQIRTVATDLTQLPGLDGTWWFNEIPWYLPFLREAVDQRLTAIVSQSDASDAGSPDADASRPGARETNFPENGDDQASKTVSPAAPTAVKQAPSRKVSGRQSVDSKPTDSKPSATGVPSSVDSAANISVAKNGTPEEMEKAFHALLGEKPDAYYDPNLVVAYDWLWDLCRRCRPSLTAAQWRLVEDLRKLTESNLPNNDHTGPVQEAYDRFIANQPKDKPLSAANLHTKALLMHRLANLRADKQTALEAGAVYAEAIAAYERTAAGGDQTAAKLLMLCRGDLARSLPIATGHYDKSLELFQKMSENMSALVQKIPNQRERRTVRSDLFYVDFLTAFGDTAAARGTYRDDLLERAARIIGNNPQLAQRTHPLSAYVAERSAWSLIDQWKIQPAATAFQEALRMRETIFQETVRKPDDDPICRFFIFHDKHGLAMAHRYQGNTERAIEEYGAIIKEIDTEIERLDAIPETARFLWFQRYRESLFARSGNTYERRGDCVLFGGAASGAFPASMLVRAADDYETAFKRAGDCNTRYVMLCKSAIIAALLAKGDETTALLRKAEEESRCALGNVQRAELMRRIAEALHLNTTDTNPGGEKLRTLLRQFLFDLNNPESARRETLELRLFCVEYLIDAELKRNNARLAAQDAEFLSVMRPFGDRPEMRPYMRRYFDLAIRAGLRGLDTGMDRKRVLNQIAQLIWWMRSSGPQEAQATAVPDFLAAPRESASPGIASPASIPHASSHTQPHIQPSAPTGNTVESVAAKPPVLLLFHFTQDPKDGFALFFPQDGSDPHIFPLEYTRSRIRESRPLELPRELVELVEKERRSGAGVRISWSDAMCWVRPGDALGDADWPFGDQLPLIVPGKTEKVVETANE